MMFFAIAPAPPWSRHAGANLAANWDALNAGMLLISVDRKRSVSVRRLNFAPISAQAKIKPPSHEAGRFDNFETDRCEGLIGS
jgi:hypothetical protein